MKKVPNISSKELLEVKRKRYMGIKYADLKRQYNISYNDILKICRFFSECNFEEEVNKELERINNENTKLKIIDHKANYQKYKKYYREYSKKQYQHRIKV